MEDFNSASSSLQDDVSQSKPNTSQPPVINNTTPNSMATIDLTTPPSTPPSDHPLSNDQGETCVSDGPVLASPPPLSTSIGVSDQRSAVTSNGEHRSPPKLPALVVDYSDSDSDGVEEEEEGGKDGGVGEGLSKHDRPPMALRFSESSDEEGGQLVLNMEAEDSMEKEGRESPMEEEGGGKGSHNTLMSATGHSSNPTPQWGGTANDKQRSDRPVSSPSTLAIDRNREGIRNPHSRHGARVLTDNASRHNKETSSARSLSDGILSDEDLNGENSSGYRVRQVAKVKRFFTTLQGFGNKMSSEVAEQVQELIAALVNRTASIEEFHQEIQTVTNHPLREFIIPFLKENLDLFREELKESSQALSDILGDPHPSSTVGLTPQLEDDEIPVLPSAKPSITATTPTSLPVPTSGSKATPVQPHSSSTVTTSHLHFPTPSHPQSVDTLGENGIEYGATPAVGGAGQGTRKRQRRLSSERTMGTSERDTQFSSNPGDRSAPGYLHKRPRSYHDHTLTNQAETSVITSPGMHRHHPPPPPTYHHPHPSHPPPPPPSYPHTSQPESHGGLTYIPVDQARRSLMSEDWNHIDLMLSSLVGMVERSRQSVSMLKDRVIPEVEKRESELEAVFQRRVHEAVEKVRKQTSEEKQRILIDASKQLRDTVAQVRGEMEGRIAQAQTLAVREALKENNMQSNSKENCWNCGRRATETCSGCNKARYCGTFCQHKDWGNHMHQCASGLQATTVVKQEPPSVLLNEVPIAMPATALVMPPSNANLIVSPSSSGLGASVITQRAPIHIIGRSYADTGAS